MSKRKMTWTKKGSDADSEASQKAKERFQEIAKPTVTKLDTTTPKPTE